MELNTAQKSELRQLLSRPVLEQAIQNALSDVWRGLSAASTLESAALAYKQQQGAVEVIEKLYASVELKRSFAVNPRRFKPETPTK